MSRLLFQTYTGYWSHVSRPIMFFFLNGNVVFPLLLFGMHISKETAILLGACITLMTVVERYGYTLPVFLLWLRSVLAGKVVARAPKIGQMRVWR